MMNSRPPRKSSNGRSRFSKAFSRLINNKIFLALFSLGLAFAIWGVLIASDGSLTRRKVLADAPVSVTGEASLISRGYIVTDNILELVPNVDMIVQVTQGTYDRATASVYNPHFELTQVTGEGENTLNVVFSSQVYGQVISCEPSSVKVNVERYITRRVPVLVELTGILPSGYYLKSYKSDPTSLTVSGPQSVVSGIARVVVRLNQNDLTAERMVDRLALNLELQRSDGSKVESDKLTVTNQSVITGSVIVETELIPLKAVPVEASEFVSGTPAKGYRLAAIELAASSVDVAASQEILDTISVITTDTPLDITDATESVTGYVRLRKLTGIDSTLPAEIGVKAVIEEEELTRQFHQVSIQVRGDSAGAASLASRRTNVRVTGKYTAVKALTADDILLSVDVTGLEAGTHVLPIKASVINQPDLTVEPDTGEVQVVIAQ